MWYVALAARLHEHVIYSYYYQCHIRLCINFIIVQISAAPLSNFPDVKSVFFTLGWICSYESIISTLLVAVYQFVSIRLDPFGTRNIITTPRCVAACVVTWVFSGALSMLFFLPSFYIVCSVVFCSVQSVTSTCYFVIYYGVSKVPCTDNVQLRQRKAENQRILRTFGLILGTSVACWVLPLVSWIMSATNHGNPCIETGANVMICMNLCANSLIYWWRLKEFRSAYSFCSDWSCRRFGPIRPEF